MKAAETTLAQSGSRPSGCFGDWVCPFKDHAARRSAFTLLPFMFFASWPVLRWFVARLGDGGDECFGLVALGLAIALTPRTLWRERVTVWRLVAAGVFVIAAALPLALPMLVRALLCVGAFAFLICRGPGALGRAGLLALALPVTATLQFFAGYPMRVLTAELGRPIIALFGVATVRAGVALQWTGGQVVVDAPCSGVHMLWAGGVLVCALAAWLHLRAWRTLALGAAGLAAILLGNVVRAAVLFFIELGLWRAPHWAHEGVGLVVFAALAAGVLWLCLRLKKTDRAMGKALPKNKIEYADSRECNTLGYIIAFGGMCMIAALLPLAGGQARAPVGRLAFPGWPEKFEGSPWIRLSKPANAAAFASGFSGETGVFRQTRQGGAERLVVLRWIREASRGVHPAADCFRASGYKVKQGGLVRDANGVVWSEFFAERDGEAWRVRERWHDGCKGAWTDVSAWYWSAVRGGGPWWAVTVAERINE